MKNVREALARVGRKVAAGTAVAAAGIGSAAASGGTGVDITEITAAIADAQTKGLAIAGSVTLLLFLFAAAKYLRRAK